MNRDVVLEGIDNTGKSTLGRYLSTELKTSYYPGEGPEKYPGECNERLRRYAELPLGQVFDRHTAISQDIYSVIYDGTKSDPALVEDFYRRNPIIIYCRPIGNRKLVGHKPTDDADEKFARKVEDWYVGLFGLYDRWALEKAHIIYRMGFPMSDVLKLVRSLLNE